MAARKGYGFERQLSKQLSLWWTGGERDDVIWRTQCSGGRATSRTKVGKTTEGQHGDLTYTNPIAKPLFDRVLIEAKCGYKKWSVMDCIDKGPKAATQQLEKWIDKAVEDSDAAGTETIWIITKRDGRQPLIFIPRKSIDELIDWHGLPPSPRLIFRLTLEKESERILLTGEENPVLLRYWYCLQFNAFLDWCSPVAFGKIGSS